MAIRKALPGEERRLYEVRMELRVDEPGGSKPPTLRGHAAVFNQPADIGGWFTETVMRGAFTKTIVEDDIPALWNHNDDYVMGRNRARTLTLEEDETGLAVEIIPADSVFARGMYVEPIQRGDVTKMSFAFKVRSYKSRDENDIWYRDLLDVQLFDVSPVTYPAYEGTDISARGLRSPEEISTEIRRGPEQPPAPGPALWVPAHAARMRRLQLAEF